MCVPKGFASILGHIQSPWWKETNRSPTSCYRSPLLSRRRCPYDKCAAATTLSPAPLTASAKTTPVLSTYWIRFSLISSTRVFFFLQTLVLAPKDLLVITQLLRESRHLCCFGFMWKQKAFNCRSGHPQTLLRNSLAELKFLFIFCRFSSVGCCFQRCELLPHVLQ